MKLILSVILILSASLAFADIVPGVTDVRVITYEGEKVELLTNVKGMTLYTFDPDGSNESNCYDACAKAWPPVLITQAIADRLEDDFHFAKRKDGTLQLTFDNHPLYLYVGDKKAGDMNGDKLGGVWHVAIDEE